MEEIFLNILRIQVVYKMLKELRAIKGIRKETVDIIAPLITFATESTQTCVVGNSNHNVSKSIVNNGKGYYIDGDIDSMGNLTIRFQTIKEGKYIKRLTVPYLNIRRTKSSYVILMLQHFLNFITQENTTEHAPIKYN